MVIEFGDWQLRPCDSLNWSLYRRCREGVDGGEPKSEWLPQRRYYSYSTIPNAAWFAADWEIRHGGGDEVVELQDALDRFTRTLEGFKVSILAALTSSTRRD